MRFWRWALTVALIGACGSLGCALDPHTIDSIVVVTGTAVGKAVDQVPSRRARPDDVEAGRTAKNAADVVYVDTEELDFGSVGVGKAARRTVDVFNPKTYAVTISEAHVVGPCFQVERSDFPIEVAPGQTIGIPVVLGAASEARCNATLILVIDSAGGRYARVRLKGVVKGAPQAWEVHTTSDLRAARLGLRRRGPHLRPSGARPTGDSG